MLCQEGTIMDKAKKLPPGSWRVLLYVGTDENGLPHMTFHDLRHLNASVMLQLGIPDKYAMERGGWSTTSTLKSVYQHTFSEEREAVNRKINEYFENIVNDTGD